MTPVNPENLPDILELEWRWLAFFERVPLEDLAILYPSVAECRTKEEFLAEDVERLRQLNALSVDQCPEELGRLAKQLPRVGARLLKGGSIGRSGARTRP